MHLIYLSGNLVLSCSKMLKTKDAWGVQFKCMHGVVGPRSLVGGQHAGVVGHRILSKGFSVKK